VPTPSPQHDDRPSLLTRFSPLAWAGYLASSWTWCIGMFLPVLLVRDYGVGAFVVFAIPNILGAAAMGWVLRDAPASRRLLARHERVAAWFSSVTVVFQALFAAYIGQLFGESFPEVSGRFLVLAIAATGSAAAFAGPGIGITAWGLSLALFLTYLGQAGWPGISRWGAAAASFSDSSTPLAWLAPVMCFGFLLCPYLDLTFHKARGSLGVGAGRAAFGIGFGLMFPAIILFTLAYSGEFFGQGLPRGGEAVALVFAHLGLQAAYTAGIHLRAIATSRTGGGARSLAWWLAAGSVFMLLLLLAAVWRAPPESARPGLRIEAEFEVIYRCFMAFYALVFPAYVWLCMIPTRDGHSGPSPGKVLVWAGAVAIATPMFWMGFIDQRTWWLGPGLGVVLLARLVLPRRNAGEPGDRAVSADAVASTP
jgi:hypothetical protein